jgi:hypothetical protein
MNEEKWWIVRLEKCANGKTRTGLWKHPKVIDTLLVQCSSRSEAIDAYTKCGRLRTKIIFGFGGYIMLQPAESEVEDADELRMIARPSNPEEEWLIDNPLSGIEQVDLTHVGDLV